MAAGALLPRPRPRSLCIQPRPRALLPQPRPHSLLLPSLLLLLFLAPALACNHRTIVLRGPIITRDKCKSCADDTPDDDLNGTTPFLPTGPSGTPTGSPTPGIVPVGDCQCGQGIKWEMIKNEAGEEQLNRPWMVHFRIELENKEHIACSGSLLNRRWIISAAHCFCVLNEHIECGHWNRGFKKEIQGSESDKDYNRTVNTRVNLTFGSVDLAHRMMRDREVGIEVIVIHPDFWADKTKHGNAYDIALVKTDKDVYDSAGLMEGGRMLVHPICLPPFGPVDWEMTGLNSSAPVEQHYLYNPSATSQYGWLRVDKPRLGFEDMDCRQTFTPEIGVPNPYGAQVVGGSNQSMGWNHGHDVNAGWLNCNPDKFKFDPYSDEAINFHGRNSFITGFGSIADPLSLNGLAPWGSGRVCRASAYSPSLAPHSTVFRRCKTNTCNKNEDNPSLRDASCQQFAATKMGELDDNRVVARILGGASGVDCYPWGATEAPEVEAFHHKPFHTGWCETVCGEMEQQFGMTSVPWGNPRNSTVDWCQVEADKNWGWCTPGCDGSMDPREAPKYFGNSFARNVHELPVDAFVYENCSINVDTLTEFCTGSPITRGKMAVYSNQGGNITKDRDEPRMWHPDGDYWNGNSTIIRMGARYQGRQHDSYEGDSCFGDAGGSVWKFHIFREPNSTMSPPPRDTKNKLAVLTGVISRFEEMCGAFSPWPSQEVGDEPNLPTQHTVHARVQTHLNWIVSHVFNESSCVREQTGSTTTTELPTTEPSTTELPTT